MLNTEESAFAALGLLQPSLFALLQMENNAIGKESLAMLAIRTLATSFMLGSSLWPDTFKAESANLKRILRALKICPLFLETGFDVLNL